MTSWRRSRRRRRTPDWTPERRSGFVVGVSALSSVHRALQVLEVVAAAGDGISAKAVARRLEYKLSTTYHLLESLVADGYLVRLEASRGFGLGPKLPALHDRLVAQLPVPRGL